LEVTFQLLFFSGIHERDTQGSNKKMSMEIHLYETSRRGYLLSVPKDTDLNPLMIGGPLDNSPYLPWLACWTLDLDEEVDRDYAADAGIDQDAAKAAFTEQGYYISRGRKPSPLLELDRAEAAKAKKRRGHS
jgi:hypothetical protein